MADDLKVVAELSVKDNLTGPASRAVARVSGDTRKLAADQARGARSARSVADALAQVDRRGQEAARSVGGVAQALARAAHTPFTSAAAQMQNLQQATGKTRREMAALLKVAGGVGHVVGAGVRVAGNVLTSTAGQVAGGIAAAGSAAHLVSMDSRYAALKANANMNKEEAAAFKSRVQGAAGATLVNEGDVMTLAEVMQDRIGDKNFYTNTLDLFAKAQKASGADARDMGEFGLLLHNMGITRREDVERALSGGIAIGDKGSFTLRDLSTYGLSAASFYKGMGRTGANALFEVDTALQLARKSKGSSAEAGTAVTAFLRDLLDPAKQKKLKKAGIQIFNKDGSVRNLLDIQKDIAVKTKGDSRKAARLGFTGESLPALLEMLSQYKRTGNFDFLKAYQVTGNEGTLDRKWRENSDTMESALTALGNSWAKIVDSLFTSPLKGAARVIADMSDGARDTTVALGALGLGALALFAKVKAGQALAGLARKYLARGGAAEAVAAGAKGGAKSAEVLAQAAAQKKGIIAAAKDAPLKLATAAEGGSAGASGAVGATAQAARGGWFSRLLKGAKGVGLLNFLFAGGAAAATELDDSLSRAQKNAAHTETAGGLAGGLTGAKVGAVAGSFAGPVGAVIGGLLGMMAGGFGGSKLGEAVGNFFFGNKEKESPEPKPIEETVMRAAQLIQSAPLAANFNLTVELDGEVIARKVEQVQLRQATRR